VFAENAGSLSYLCRTGATLRAFLRFLDGSHRTVSFRPCAVEGGASLCPRRPVGQEKCELSPESLGLTIYRIRYIL
jgi:hypothetical protein